VVLEKKIMAEEAVAAEEEDLAKHGLGVV